MAWTYILECSDGSYYWASRSTSNDGCGSTTRSGRAGLHEAERPVRVVWSAHYDSVEQAFGYEKQIQGWSRRKREALIRGGFELLPESRGGRRVRRPVVSDGVGSRWLRRLR